MMAMIIEALSTLGLAVWLMLPAYVPNSSAAIFGGGTPIDFGHAMRDGHRILGDGKTYRGLVIGTFCGFAVGFLQWLAVNYLGLNIPVLEPPAIFTMAFGAMLGDMLASFTKRRAGLERGSMLPVMDQLDFVLGAWLLTFLLLGTRFTEFFTLPIIIAALIITPVLHILVNQIGYRMGKKEVPW